MPSVRHSHAWQGQDSLLDELSHCADGLFNGDVLVRPMKVEELNVISLELLERGLELLAHVCWRAIDRSVRTHREAKFGSEKNLVAFARLHEPKPTSVRAGYEGANDGGLYHLPMSSSESP
jgi:hypothetical protein